VTQLFFGPFAYFKAPWVQTAGFQLILAAGSLLIVLTAAPAWLISWFVRRRRGGARSSHWAQAARWTAAGSGLFSAVLLALGVFTHLQWFQFESQWPFRPAVQASFSCAFPASRKMQKC
jgi:hypothetical protein